MSSKHCSIVVLQKNAHRRIECSCFFLVFRRASAMWVYCGLLVLRNLYVHTYIHTPFIHWVSMFFPKVDGQPASPMSSLRAPPQGLGERGPEKPTARLQKARRVAAWSLVTAMRAPDKIQHETHKRELFNFSRIMKN